MLVVHQWFMYTVLALEVVPQTVLIAVFSAVGGFLVWWSQLHAIDELIASSKDERDSARLGDERDSALIALVSWCARPPRCNPMRCRLQPHASRLQPHAHTVQPTLSARNPTLSGRSSFTCSGCATRCAAAPVCCGTRSTGSARRSARSTSWRRWKRAKSFLRTSSHRRRLALHPLARTHTPHRAHAMHMPCTRYAHAMHMLHACRC